MPTAQDPATPTDKPDLIEHPTADEILAILKRLTWNGAYNLRRTITNPHARFPDLLNGGERITTGLGKWTHIAMLGVLRNLTSLELIEERWIPWNGPDTDKSWKCDCLTPLGRHIAEHVHDHWGDIAHKFRDGSKNR